MKNEVEIIDHLGVCETNYLYSEFLECAGAIFIICSLFGASVIFAVYLNGKVSFMAVKVDNENSNRVLPSKLESPEFAISQAVPENFLRFGHGLSVFPGEGEYAGLSIFMKVV